MFSRLLLALGMLATATSAGHTQSPNLVLPEPCRVAIGEELPELEKRRQTLEHEVTRKTASMPPETDPRSQALAQSLRKSQEELLNVMFQLDCLNIQRKLEPSKFETRRALPKAAKAPKAADVIEVTTYYATNRNRSGSVDPVSFYGSKVEPTLHYGRAIVTIPITHSPGSIEMPSLWRLEREADPNKHFVLKSVVPLNTDAARKEMAEKLEGSGSKALLVFVHGYNMGFRETAMRTAQLAHDLKFLGVPFFYSWPSANRVIGYLQDAEAAQLSEGVFEQLLEELSQLPASDIYIVAHSMGNRIVGQALKARAERGKETKHLRELLLAAPDISVDLFRTVIAPRLAAMQGTRTTVYASSSDLALRASKAVHGFRRVGETTGGVFVYPGMETIDASSASLIIRGYGHSYLMDNPSVLRDIQSIIQQRVSAKERGLGEAGTSPNTYWKLP